jgi:hypothetical protein
MRNEAMPIAILLMLMAMNSLFFNRFRRPDPEITSKHSRSIYKVETRYQPWQAFAIFK